MTRTIQMIIFCQARNHPNLSQKITSVLFHGVHSYVVDTLCWRIDNKLLWSSLNDLLLSNFTRNDIQSYENEGFHSFDRVAPKGNLIGRMTWQSMADMAVPYYGCLHLNCTAQHWQGRYMAVLYNSAYNLRKGSELRKKHHKLRQCTSCSQVPCTRWIIQCFCCIALRFTAMQCKKFSTIECNPQNALHSMPLQY